MAQGLRVKRNGGKKIMDRKNAIEKLANLAAGAPFGNLSYGCPGTEIAEMFSMAAQALREKEERENQKPLTVEELNKRVHSPTCIESTDGVIIKMPYKIGTTVYCLHDDGPLKKTVVEQTVCGYSESKWQGSINRDKDYRFIICHNSYNMPIAWQLKNVFSTRKAAETELENRSNSQN
jgi:hypothetical protein